MLLMVLDEEWPASPKSKLEKELTAAANVELASGSVFLSGVKAG